MEIMKDGHRNRRESEREIEREMRERETVRQRRGMGVLFII